MYELEAILGTFTCVILLLAVLRYRQHPLPATVPIGAFLLCAGQLFSLAVACLGFERTNQLVEGRLFVEDDFNWHLAGGEQVSPEFILFQSLFTVLAQLALLMLTIGLLHFLHRLVRRQTDPVAR